jgi:hypothetical protein
VVAEIHARWPRESRLPEKVTVFFQISDEGIVAAEAEAAGSPT